MKKIALKIGLTFSLAAILIISIQAQSGESLLNFYHKINDFLIFFLTSCFLRVTSWLKLAF